MTAANMALPEGLPPLGGRLFLAYRIAWCALAVAAAAAAVFGISGNAPFAVLAVRLIKTLVVGTAATLLLFRRSRDPVAAILALAFLCWIVTSSVEFTSGAMLPVLLDRLRFLLFAFALLLFPDGRWSSRWPRFVAAASLATFVLGLAESFNLTGTHLFLPSAILCVVAAISSLVQRYRRVTDEVQEQQLKWVAWGLVVGVGAILAARAGAKVGAGSALAFDILFQLGIIIIAIGFLVPLVRYRLYDAETVISRSAALAGLTGALVATFAGSEALIEAVGQQYLGASGSNGSGAIAAAVAAVLLAPLHGKISNWAEARFQTDLVKLKTELPELLADFPLSWRPDEVGQAALPLIADSVHADWAALDFNGRRIAFFQREGAGRAGDRSAEALRMPLVCRLGAKTGALIIGRRPDGTSLGSDEREALREILSPLHRRLRAADHEEIRHGQIERLERALHGRVLA
jgi:hypothetical protein